MQSSQIRVMLKTLINTIIGKSILFSDEKKSKDSFFERISVKRDEKLKNKSDELHHELKQMENDLEKEQKSRRKAEEMISSLQDELNQNRTIIVPERIVHVAAVQKVCYDQ